MSECGRIGVSIVGAGRTKFDRIDETPEQLTVESATEAGGILKDGCILGLHSIRPHWPVTPLD